MLVSRHTNCYTLSSVQVTNRFDCWGGVCSYKPTSGETKEVIMEKWMIVEGFEEYEVSDRGRVRRAVPGRNTFVGKILLQSMTTKGSRGRLRVGLWHKGKCCFKLVHVLVAKAFIPNPLNLPEVNHLGKSDDCRANKLEWRSKLGNVQHSVLTERKGTGGVSFEKRRKHWVAYLNTNYTHKYVGSFPTKRAALAARRAAVKAVKEVV